MVSSTGMALISKPVNGQYTIITVASRPAAVSGAAGARFSILTNGRRRSAIRINGTILIRVRMVSVFPAREIPMMLMQQNPAMIPISMTRYLRKPEVADILADPGGNSRDPKD